MSKLLASLGSGSGVMATVAVGAVVVAGAAWFQFGPQNEVEVTPVVAVAPEAPTIAPAGETASKPAESVAQAEETVPAQVPTETAEAEEATPVEVPPAFDEVRREADGMTVIAGRAAPGAVVQILQNGLEIANARADGSGKFATLAMIPPDGQGHVLSLLQVLGEDKLASLDEIILAPLAAPVAVAEVADPDPEPVMTEVETAEAVVEEEQAPVTAEVASTETQEAITVAEAPVSGTDVADEDTETPVIAEVVPTPTVSEETATVVAEATETAEATEETEAAATPTEAPEVVTETEVAVESPQPEADEPTVVAAADPAPAAVAVLKSTAEGVELLNPAAPDVMDNVALDIISYSEAGDVQLSGRAQADTRAVRVYLNNDAVVSLDVASDGSWRGDIPNIDEGIYTLRVDEVASDGSVTSRVETPFKRESPEVLAAALAAQDGPIKAITVQKGATLWAIARERYGRGELYVRVFEANQDLIRDANLIYPGQVFDLPD